MKKSELMRLSIPQLRTGKYYANGNTFICNAVKHTGAKIEQMGIAYEIVEDIMDIINPDDLESITFYQYAISKIGLPHLSRENDEFFQFLRMKFMEMLIETYELKGE